MPGVTFLGNPDLLDNSRYQWTKAKVPKNKESENFKDNEFTFNVINFYDFEPDLLIRFKPRKNRFLFWEGAKLFFVKQSPIFLTVRNYRELTALDILHDLYNGCEHDAPLGRHFEDGLFAFYQAHGLDLGFVRR